MGKYQVFSISYSFSYFFFFFVKKFNNVIHYTIVNIPHENFPYLIECIRKLSVAIFFFNERLKFKIDDHRNSNLK